MLNIAFAPPDFEAALVRHTNDAIMQPQHTRGQPIPGRTIAMSKDSIRIAGAGLAGLSSAIGLARRGHRVEIFEKNTDSGAARHSDWDAIENWTTEDDMLTLLDAWGIAPSFEHRSQLEFEVYDKDGVCYPVTTARPFFYLLKRGPERGSVEQELKRQALDHGVAIRYGQP